MDNHAGADKRGLRRGCSSRFLCQTVVVIPALNEAVCLEQTVSAWLRLGAAHVRVIDNGSQDETATVARRAGAEVIGEPQRGYGAAAWRGLQGWNPRTPWVLFSSADGSDRLEPRELPTWQEAVDAGADLIVGNRLAYPEARAHLSLAQKIGNRISCAVIRAGWNQRFQDMGSLRLARRDALVKLGLTDRAFGWNVEMQVRALECGWRIVELPVHYYPRHAGESKISGNLLGTIQAGKGILRMLALLWRLRLSRRYRAWSRSGLPASSPPVVRA